MRSDSKAVLTQRPIRLSGLSGSKAVLSHRLIWLQGRSDSRVGDGRLSRIIDHHHHISHRLCDPARNDRIFAAETGAGLAKVDVDGGKLLYLKFRLMHRPSTGYFVPTRAG